MTDSTTPLIGQVAVVAGATRGAGRGIARMLAAAGAKVYCTGRSTRADGVTDGGPETLDETVEMIEAAGGQAVAMRTDHTVPEQVQALFERIGRDEGRCEVLVNDVWGGDRFIDWSAKFWSLDIQKVRVLLDQAVVSHLITARCAAPIMVEAGRGLIVEVTDGELPGYRGQLLYDLVKASVNRLGYAMAWDLANTGVTALTVSPGFLRSEQMLRNFGVTEDTWRDGIARDPFFAESETPAFVGRAIAALAADPQVGRKAGLALFACDLAQEYGFTDLDGGIPQFWEAAEAWLDGLAKAGGPLQSRERQMGRARYGHIHLTPSRGAQARRLADRLGLENLGGGLQPAG